VARRVSPVERIRTEIDQLFGSGHDLALVLEDVARLSVRLVFQTALEAEVEEFLGTPVAVIANVPTPGSTKVALQVISLPARPVFWPKVLVNVSGLPPSGVKVPVNEVST
jgi:hypothetical protein